MDISGLDKILAASQTYKECILSKIDEASHHKSINARRDDYLSLHTLYSKSGKYLEKVIQCDCFALVSSNAPLIANNDRLCACMREYLDRKTSLKCSNADAAASKGSIEEYNRLMGDIEACDVSSVVAWIDALDGEMESVVQLKVFLVCCKVANLVENGQALEAVEVCRLYHRLLFSPADQGSVQAPTALGTLSLAGLIGGFLESTHAFDWDQAKVLLQKVYCEVTGLSVTTHLETWYLDVLIASFVAGVRSIPPLSRLTNLLRRKNIPGVPKLEELPVTISLATEKHYHSLFSCPVLRVQSTNKNPPMMLVCGHAVCKEALSRLSKGNSFMKFKCPYCPVDCTANQCIKLHL